MSLANPRWGAPRIQWGIDETRYFDLANNRRQVHDPVSEATITTSQRFSASLDSEHWSSGYRMRIELQVGHTWVVFLQTGFLETSQNIVASNGFLQGEVLK